MVMLYFDWHKEHEENLPIPDPCVEKVDFDKIKTF